MKIVYKTKSCCNGFTIEAIDEENNNVIAGDVENIVGKTRTILLIWK